MKTLLNTTVLAAFSTLITANSALAADQEPSTPPAIIEGSQQEARLVSAFFGLDNALPFRANALCFGASKKDGMPVVLSHTVDPDVLEPEQFQVVTRSGKLSTPKCVTLRPAYDIGERRTVLLIGEFGDAPDDPPVSVQVVGDLHSEGSRQEISPVAIAELGDGDNNHFLCLDSADPAVNISFPGGHLVDPNQDLNPDTQITVSRNAN